jgi:hypothetical protein
MKLRKGESTDLDDAFLGTCENCEEATWVRPIEAKDMMFKEISRGWYNICFYCFTPRIIWNHKMYGTMRSPTYMTREQVDEYFKGRKK